MKLALLQMDPAWERPEENHKHAEAMLERATETGADVAVLPEMFSTGFSFTLEGLAEPNVHPTHMFLAQASRSLDINVVAGFKALAPGQPGRGLNLARAYGRDGSVSSTYIKIHPFSYAGEHEAMEAGPGPVVFSLEGVPASMFICYDLRFPEVFRPVARRCLVIFVLANWPESRQEHWNALLRARAIENQCFVAGVNRSGTDANGIRYMGGSLVFNPLGEEVVRGGTEEELVLAEIEPHNAQDIRTRFPFLDDMAL